MFKYSQTILWIFIFFQFILSQQQVYEDDLKPGSNENGYASYEDEDEAQYDQLFDEDQYQFQTYAEHMTTFRPTQTFQFQLDATEQETLILWPTNQVIGIRGVFYLNDNNKGLFMGVQIHGQIKKSYYNKKLGVFRVPFEGAGDIKLIFKAQIQSISVYISYQLQVKKEDLKVVTIDYDQQEDKQIQQQQKKQEQVKQQNNQEQLKQQKQQKNQEQVKQQKQQKQGEKQEEYQQINQQVIYEGEKKNEDAFEEYYGDKKELQHIVLQFEGVRNSLQFQQIIVKGILQHSMLETQRLEQQINNKSIKLIIQTIFVIGSGIFSLWMLNKQLKRGYQFLI